MTGSSDKTKGGIPLFTRLKNWIRGNVPVFARVLFAVAAFAGLMHLLSVIFSSFADFFNIRVAGVVRFFLAKITGLIPFSLSELYIAFLPFALIAVVVISLRLTKRDDPRIANRFVAAMFAVLTVFYTFFVFTSGTGYYGKTLDEKLGLELKERTSDELTETAKWLIDEINALTNEVHYKHEGASVMPYTFAEMNEKLCDAYNKASKKYDFIMGYSSRLKPVMAGALMSRMGMLGMYSYYTGEANVSVDYPDYTTVYTCAHELSHQRGISKEDEANFMAFLVCLESDDPYIRYCGYLNVYEYVRIPLKKILDEEKRASTFDALERTLDARAATDVNVSITKSKEVQGTVTVITEKIHDAVISISDKRGTASYGYVVDLVAAYQKERAASDR